MSVDRGAGHLDETLARLRVHDLGAERAERIRQGCLAALAARRGHLAGRSVPRPGRLSWLEPAAALAACVAYLAAAAQLSLEFLRAVR